MSNTRGPLLTGVRITGQPTARQRRSITMGILALGLFASCAVTHALAASDAAPAPPILVREGDKLKVPSDSPLRSRLVVAPVEQSAAPHALTFPGMVEADPAQTVNVLPPATGQLLSLPVRLGDVVRANQVLAVIASPDLAQAFADAERARDALALAEKALARAKGVNEAGASALKELEQAQSTQVQAAAELMRAQTRLRSLGISDPEHERPHPLEVRAPVAGTLTSFAVGTGSFINDPTAAIMTISNLDNVWVTASVPESSLAVLSRGLAAEVNIPALPGITLTGRIDSVSPVLDPDTRRAKARIVFHNRDGKLKTNMYANVSVATPQASEPTVPSSALLMNNDDTTVFVEASPWVFVRRVVEIGSEDGETVRIRSGLRAGERVVVRGGVLLND